MIIALNTEQLQEMAKVFEAAQATSGPFEAPWWMGNEAGFPNHNEEDGIEMKEAKDNNTSKSNNTPAATTSTSTEDSKPAAKKSPPKNFKKASCTPRKNPGNCRPYYHRSCDPNAVFQHFLRMKNAAHCQKQANKTTRIVEQKTPIHMHEETDAAAKMSLDLTGFSPSNISIHVEDYIVNIVANRTNKLGDVFVVDRRFRLDKKTANVDQVTSTFEDGILELTVPKKSVVGPRKIPIIVSSSVDTTGTIATSKVETKQIEEDNEVSQAPSSFVSKDLADEEYRHDQTSEEEESKLQEEHEDSQPDVTVETVSEEKEDIEEDQQSHATDIASTKSAAEDETWEEVSN